MEELKDLYTAKEVADLLGFTTQAVRNYIRCGKLKAIKLNGGYLIAKEDVERLLEEKGAK